jgi:diguanylate cyclase (GGDEF)-like protein
MFRPHSSLFLVLIAACFFLSSTAIYASEKDEISTLLTKANQYIELTQYQQGLELLIKAYQLSHAKDDPEIHSDILSAMAHAYYITGQLEQAHRYYQQLLTLDEESDDKAALSITLFNLGHVNASQKDYALADQHFQRSLKLSEELNDLSGVAFTLKALGVNAHAQSNFDVAKDYLNQSLAIFEQINDKSQSARIHRHLADIAYQLHQYNLAIDHYKVALSDLRNELHSKALMRTHRGLSNTYAALSNHQQALHHHRLYTELSQKDLTQQSKEMTRRLQVQFETQHFANENEWLALINKSQEKELEHQESLLHMQYLAIALAGGIIFLILVLWSRTKQHAFEMQLLASTDELTGIRNRRAVLQAGDEEFQRSLRFKRSLSCLVLDLDYFKEVNDNYGHSVGDDVLKSFSTLVEETLRKADLFGRLGGEEFLIIASEANAEQSMNLAERIKQVLTKLTHEAMEDRTITVSIGIAELSDQSHIEELVAHADKALYQAKKNGRNQAVNFSSL